MGGWIVIWAFVCCSVQCGFWIEEALKLNSSINTRFTRVDLFLLAAGMVLHSLCGWRRRRIRWLLWAGGQFQKSCVEYIIKWFDLEREIL